jgi:hypothetical protein
MAMTVINSIRVKPRPPVVFLIPIYYLEKKIPSALLGIFLHLLQSGDYGQPALGVEVAVET